MVRAERAHVGRCGCVRSGYDPRDVARFEMKEKQKKGDNANNDQLGDCYCWVAIERNTKLVLSYVVADVA